MKDMNRVTAKEKNLIKKMIARSFTIFAPFSYAKHGGSGFCYALMPFINAFYKTEEEKRAALSRHIVWFNTTQNVSTFIMGLAASMEKENSQRNDFDSESINAVKSSLMGPLAGIGDSLFWGVLRVVAAGVVLGMASQGSILAPVLFLMIYNVPSILCRYYLGFLGYSLGSKYIQQLYASGLINILTKAAGILGLLMIGGMTSNIVTFQSSLTISTGGDSAIVMQDILDQIFIGLVPLCVTLLCFFLMSKKKVHFNYIMIGIIVFSIFLSVIGVA